MVTPEKKRAPLCFFVLCEYLRTYTACSAPFTFSIFRYVRIAKICSAALIRGAKTVIYRLRLLLQAVGQSRGANSSPLYYKGRKSNFPLGAFFRNSSAEFPAKKNRKKMRTSGSSSERTEKNPWGSKKLQPRSKENASPPSRGRSVGSSCFFPSLHHQKERKKNRRRHLDPNSCCCTCLAQELDRRRLLSLLLLFGPGGCFAKIPSPPSQCT